jgi:hypothetical protein
MRFVFIVFAFLVSSIAMAGANEKQTKTIAGYVSDEPGFQRELKALNLNLPVTGVMQRIKSARLQKSLSVQSQPMEQFLPANW